MVSAIKSRDGDALAPLYLTEKDVADACPADTPKDYAEHARWLAANLRASIGRDLETCARLLPDWSKAVHEKIQGGDDRAAAVGCDALEIVTYIVITYQGGGETIYIVLANALRRGDRGFILTDKIACRVADLVRPGE